MGNRVALRGRAEWDAAAAAAARGGRGLLALVCELEAAACAANCAPPCGWRSFVGSRGGAEALGECRRRALGLAREVLLAFCSAAAAAPPPGAAPSVAKLQGVLLKTLRWRIFLDAPGDSATRAAFCELAAALRRGAGPGQLAGLARQAGACLAPAYSAREPGADEPPAYSEK